MYRESMLKDLRKLNIKNENIIDKIHLQLIRRTHLHKLQVNITDHCNLNCAGCSTFSPLVKEPLFADFDIFDSDMARMSSLLRMFPPDNLFITGGETLLNPDICLFLKSAKKHFSKTMITLLSNGILLPKMPDSFWNTCRENKIGLLITRYTKIKFNYDQLPIIASKHNVEFSFFGSEFEHGDESWNIALNPLGNQEPYESFTNCFMANDCISLRNGKLYPCPIIPNIDFFNKSFGTNMQPCSNDYIDIYKAKNMQEILEFLAKPIPFCKYCNANKRTYDSSWHVSKREIGEWVVETL
jgi:MoaA/NifB/PqqE/SkfB family radical SAM enzyme